MAEIEASVIPIPGYTIETPVITPEPELHIHEAPASAAPEALEVEVVIVDDILESVSRDFATESAPAPAPEAEHFDVTPSAPAPAPEVELVDVVVPSEPATAPEAEPILSEPAPVPEVVPPPPEIIEPVVLPPPAPMPQPSVPTVAYPQNSNIHAHWRRF